MGYLAIGNRTLGGKSRFQFVLKATPKLFRSVVAIFQSMKDTDLLQLPLGLQTPWQVTKVEFDSVKGQLTTLIDFPKGDVVQKKMIPSMSRKGDCWDNSPMERFFRSLK